MIQWPNIGLWGQFEPCEEGILEKINSNFALLDALTQLMVLDIVSELPEDPNLGDKYIINDTSYIYSPYDSAIAIFDGNDWIYIPAREGYLAYVNNQGFFWYNGLEWVHLLATNDIQVMIPNNVTNYGTGIMLDESKYVSYTIRLCGYRKTDAPVNLRSLITFDCVWKEGVGWLTPERQMRPENLGVTAIVVGGEFCLNTTNIAGANYEGFGTLKILDRAQIEVLP